MLQLGKMADFIGCMQKRQEQLHWKQCEWSVMLR